MMTRSYSVWRSMFRSVSLGLLLGGLVFYWRMAAIGNDRLESVRERVQPALKQALEGRGLRLGAAVFLRAFKESSELELWVEKDKGKPWELFHTWQIAAWSGQLGPKLREGDGQTPEGFYEVKNGQLNPRSTFHLSFNIGYPNGYDRHHGRTGSLIMVHGSNVSIGCLAMTDPVIEQLYLLVEAALAGGQQRVPVHLFPFRMTAERMAEAETEAGEWLDFWRAELQPIYKAFEETQVPPVVTIKEGRYGWKPSC